MDLVELVPSLKRAVAVPGTFESLFPETTNTDLVASLLDGFSEAQLDGWFAEVSATNAGLMTPTLDRSQGALIVLYAATRLLVSEIRNRKTHRRYEASGNVFEEDQSANTLVQLLKDLQARKKQLIAQATKLGGASGFVMGDAYLARLTGAGHPW